jgi:glutamate synthase domain-containing protein 2
VKIRQIRTQVLQAVVLLDIAFTGAGILWSPWFLLGLVVSVPLTLVGVTDLLQKEHALLRNYPIIGHLRFLIEGTGAELRQYVVESNTEGRPFNRDTRSLIYQRSKNLVDKKPFGTEKDVYAETYGWLAHSMAPAEVAENASRSFRVDVGGDDCKQPYAASVFNISSMSYGSLSGAAIRALNTGAQRGGFAHWTGEGGISRFHSEPGGDLVWQIGTGYFGCRSGDGGFDADQFKERAHLPQVKMIEIKLSQGAKPGHGGILPARKVTPEIAEARAIPVGKSCVSPPFHREFSTPVGLCEFVAKLRELSGGKPIGFKLCVGRFDEFFAVCKAMLQTGILPDFIAVDGAEGGTGAAPIEFSDNIGVPIREGVVFVHNSLRGIGVRDKVRVAAAGKLVTAYEIAAAMSLGADWINSARGFMFALGCIQAQSCHTNECPVGVATQDPRLARALVVGPKAERVHHFHKNTVEALAEVIAAAGLEHPSELTPKLLFQRISPTDIRSFATLYSRLKEGQLLEGQATELMQPYWDAASAESFQAKPK